MEKVWTAVVHYAGNGARLHDSHCLVRLYADHQDAVVVVTELKQNQGKSVTDAYEEIATKLKAAVTQFIPEANWPERVRWIEQYEDRPEELYLVLLAWDGQRFVCPPHCRRLTGHSDFCGVSWDELCRVSPTIAARLPRSA